MHVWKINISGVSGGVFPLIWTSSCYQWQSQQHPHLIISNLISCTRIRIYVLYSMSLFDGPDGFRLDLTWYYERQSLLYNLYNISDLHKRSKRSPVLRRRRLTSNINPLTFHIVRSGGPSMVGPLQSLNGGRLLLSPFVLVVHKHSVCGLLILQFCLVS